MPDGYPAEAGLHIDSTSPVGPSRHRLLDIECVLDLAIQIEFILGRLWRRRRQWGHDALCRLTGRCFAATAVEKAEATLSGVRHSDVRRAPGGQPGRAAPGP